MPYLNASAVVIHYEEALYRVYGPLYGPLTWLCARQMQVSPQSVIDIMAVKFNNINLHYADMGSITLRTFELDYTQRNLSVTLTVTLIKHS